MKPRNKHERHVVGVSDRLPKLTKVQMEYAFEHCFKHKYVKRCGKYHCLDCGFEWPAGTNDVTLFDSMGGADCPVCGHHLEVEVTRKKSWFARSSFQIVTAVDDVQFVRTFYLRKYFTVGKPAQYWIDEAVRVCIMQGKPDVVIARPLIYNGYYCDSYSFNKELSIKMTNNSNYYRGDAYYVDGDVVYPRRKVIPMLKRNGYCKELYGFGVYGIISQLLDNPKVETVVKAGRFDILHGISYYEIGRKWPQVKMLIRHHYHPSDFGMWKDTVEMAQKLGLDTHSPKYILPEDLQVMHDRLSRKITEIEERKRAKEAEEENKQYRKEHGMVLGVVIVENDMRIAPLQTKLDFIDEGKAMNHCVATYFDKKNSLILSVRLADSGKRLATVELSMKDFSIKQCRANSNKQPERYAEICNVINAHRGDFCKAIADGYRKEDLA